MRERTPAVPEGNIPKGINYEEPLSRATLASPLKWRGEWTEERTRVQPWRE